LTAKLGGAAATLLTTMLLARLLSKPDFAGYVIIGAVAMLGGVFGSLGMGNAILRFAGFYLGVGRFKAARQVTWRCLAIGAAGLLVTALTLSLSQGVLAKHMASWPTHAAVAPLIGLWLFGNGMLLLTTSALRAYGKIGLGSVMEFTLPRLAVLSATAVVFALQLTSIVVVLVATACIVSLLCLVSFVTLWRAVQQNHQSTDDSNYAEDVPFREIAHCALPLLGSQTLFQAMTDSSLFFVAHYCSVEATALYAATYRLWGVSGLPQSAVASAIQGRIAELHAQADKRATELLIRSSANLAMLPTVLGAAVGCLFAGPLLMILFGDSFAAAAHLLMTFCLLRCPSVACGPAVHMLAMSGKQGMVFVVALTSAIFGIVAGWALTSSYGALGGVWAVGLATTLFHVQAVWQVSRVYGIRSWIGRNGGSQPRRSQLLPTPTSEVL